MIVVVQIPQKNTREITDHHVLRMFRKCRRLNLKFFKDSYVTWERRRLDATKFQAFGGLLESWGHLGDILGVFRGLYWYILGVRHARGSICLIKTVLLFRSRGFRIEKCRKVKILARLQIPNCGKMVVKKVKQIQRKKLFIRIWFPLKMVFSLEMVRFELLLPN